MSTRWPKVGLLLVAQLMLVALAVLPQLSARLTGEEYLLRVAPVDPIDPFRGAYVDLDYPDLPDPDVDDSERGDVFLPLREDGEVWVVTGYERERPASGPYLACDDADWRIRCGIESWFLPQDEARALEEAVAGGDMVARVRVDGRGNAALMGVEPAP